MVPSRASLLLLLLALAGCGDPPAAKCTASTCQGCCAADGTCQGGGALDACGSNGNACLTCNFAQSCSAGFCVTSSSGGGNGGGTGGGSGGGGGNTCRPTTCVALGKNCGQADDGCGGLLQCGLCEVPGESCGAGGVANVCAAGVCNPRSCVAQGTNCGPVSDGCGALLDCGSCTAPDTCGGGGTTHVCGHGCVPTTCTALGKNCGSVSDGCGGMLSCGTCGGVQSCVANVCGQSCSPRSCTQQGKNCGPVDDGCGTFLDCGTCTNLQTCGGAGTPSVCGGMCTNGCPTGYSCDTSGVCAGGNQAAVVFNVPVPPLHLVSGKVTLNGADATATLCSTSTRAHLAFEHTTDTRFSSAMDVPGCTNLTDPYTFSGSLYPGTYKVTVTRGVSGGSTLPTWATIATTMFTVSAPQSGVVFNVPVPPLHLVSGKVTINGADAVATLCSTSTRAHLSFEHTTDTRFSSAMDVPGCTNLTDPYTFSGQLYPGTYKVTVTRGVSGGSTLPTWATVTNAMFTVSAPQSGVLFDVPVPPLHLVSGKVTINGADATATLCSTSTRAHLSFENLADARFSSAMDVPGCSNLTDPYTFSGQLYPGTYKVTVTRGVSGGSTLPTWATISNALFVVSAPQSGVLFDVPVPPLRAISGKVTINGADAAATLCSTSTRAHLAFDNTADTRFSSSMDVPGCTNLTDPYTFSGQLYPGTYKVTVTRGVSGGSTLPTWATVSNAMFTVSAGQSGVVFDVPVPVQHLISGKVTINGADATATLCSTSTRAHLAFDNTADARFSSSMDVAGCTNLTDPYTFSGQLYPGTYKVTVTRGVSGGSTLPTWATISNAAFTVSAAQSGVLFDVPVPPLRTVSGRITLNGVDATATLCSTSTRAHLVFEHLTDSRFSSSADVPGCTNLNDPYTFTTQLYPGVYKVTVTRGVSGGSTLPTWSTVVVDRLQVL